MSARHVYVDETKRAGYVLAAVTVDDPAAVRRVIRGLILPGQRRLHMHNEQARRRRAIVSALATMPIRATVYDAGRGYRTDRAARSACLATLVEDLAAAGIDTQLVIEQDDSLLHNDRHELYQLVHRAAADQLAYRHQRAHEDQLLALPDVVAWCWVRSAEWRRRITPVVDQARQV